MTNRATLLANAKNLPPVDENVQLPPAVRAAAEAAEAAFRAQSPQLPEENNPPTPEIHKPADETITIVEPQPQSKQTPTQPTTQTGNEPPPNFEHMYNSQLGRVREQNRTIEGLNNRLESMAASMSALQQELQKRPTTAAPAAPDIDIKKLFTDQQRADYGDEMLEIMATTSKKIAEQLVTTSTKDIDQRLSVTSTAMAATAKDRLHATLDERVPDWQAINFSDEFKSWLALPDEYSGAIRHTLLNEAYERNDGPRTVAFFKGFLSEKAATAPAPTTSLPPAPNSGQPAKPGLETFAAPGRARTAATPSSPAEKPILTHSDIAGFYDEVRRGVYKGREEEHSRREAMIFEAQRDGRVRAG